MIINPRTFDWRGVARAVTVVFCVGLAIVAAISAMALSSWLVRLLNS